MHVELWNLIKSHVFPVTSKWVVQTASHEESDTIDQEMV